MESRQILYIYSRYVTKECSIKNYVLLIGISEKYKKQKKMQSSLHMLFYYFCLIN